MGRRFRGPVRPNKEEHRVNKRIRFPQIRVIDPDGNQLGVMTPDEGREVAGQHDLDLVEVAPNARPPVCRILDYGKFKYDKNKQSSNQRSAPTVKTVQFRPKTDDHDLNTKLKAARKFLARGDKVRLVMRMRGREQAYPQRWVEMMRDHFRQHLANVAHVAQAPKREGRRISMLVEPTTA